jgi:acyl-CoA thioesterase FadM
MSLTIWPQDLDIYGHLNNGRYLTLMDNGRLMHGLRTGMVKLMFEKKWVPVLGAAAIEFKRELRAFERCQLTTRWLGWDSKWIYVEHRLERGDVLHARAIVRAVVKHGRRTVPCDELLAEMGHPATSPFSPEELAAQVASAVVPT